MLEGEPGVFAIEEDENEDKLSRDISGSNVSSSK